MKVHLFTQINRQFTSAASPLFLIMALSLLQSPARAQGDIQFAPPVTNAFNMDLPSLGPGQFVAPSLVDIDGDKDLDIFMNVNSNFPGPCATGIELRYYENKGSNECPEFPDPPLFNPFGIPDSFSDLIFVDINGDEAVDIFAFQWCKSKIYYLENTGSDSLPVFGNSPLQINPFGIDPGGIWSSFPTFCDLDSDGDVDMFLNGGTSNKFKFQENIGSATNPVFDTVVDNPFSLSIPVALHHVLLMSCLDWDCDGDMDILNSFWKVDSNAYKLYYYENIGSPTEPSFALGENTGYDFPLLHHADLDGDGDEDFLRGVKFKRNVTQDTGCVKIPIAGFGFAKEGDGLSFQFNNQSTGIETSCNPIHWHWDFGDGHSSTEQHPRHTYSTYNALPQMVCLITTDVSGADTICQEVSIATGVFSPVLQSVVKIYPNPVQHQLHLEWEDPDHPGKVSVALLDPTGQVVERLEDWLPSQKPHLIVDMADLPDGLYFLRGTGELGAFTYKIIKVK